MSGVIISYNKASQVEGSEVALKSIHQARRARRESADAHTPPTLPGTNTMPSQPETVEHRARIEMGTLFGTFRSEGLAAGWS